MANVQQAELVVGLANDTIRYLTHLNNTTNLYRKLREFEGSHSFSPSS
jgi:flagellar biogenesis protein FliO